MVKTPYALAWAFETAAEGNLEKLQVERLQSYYFPSFFVVVYAIKKEFCSFLLHFNIHSNTPEWFTSYYVCSDIFMILMKKKIYNKLKNSPPEDLEINQPAMKFCKLHYTISSCTLMHNYDKNKITACAQVSQIFIECAVHNWGWFGINFNKSSLKFLWVKVLYKNCFES